MFRTVTNANYPLIFPNIVPSLPFSYKSPVNRFEIAAGAYRADVPNVDMIKFLIENPHSSCVANTRLDEWNHFLMCTSPELNSKDGYTSDLQDVDKKDHMLSPDGYHLDLQKQDDGSYALSLFDLCRHVQIWAQHEAGKELSSKLNMMSTCAVIVIALIPFFTLINGTYQITNNVTIVFLAITTFDCLFFLRTIFTRFMMGAIIDYRRQYIMQRAFNDLLRTRLVVLCVVCMLCCNVCSVISYLLLLQITHLLPCRSFDGCFYLHPSSTSFFSPFFFMPHLSLLIMYVYLVVSMQSAINPMTSTSMSSEFDNDIRFTMEGHWRTSDRKLYAAKDQEVNNHLVKAFHGARESAKAKRRPLTKLRSVIDNGVEHEVVLSSDEQAGRREHKDQHDHANASSSHDQSSAEALSSYVADAVTPEATSVTPFDAAAAVNSTHSIHTFLKENYYENTLMTAHGPNTSSSIMGFPRISLDFDGNIFSWVRHQEHTCHPFYGLTRFNTP